MQTQVSYCETVTEMSWACRLASGPIKLRLPSKIAAGYDMTLSCEYPVELEAAGEEAYIFYNGSAKWTLEFRCPDLTVPGSMSFDGDSRPGVGGLRWMGAGRFVIDGAEFRDFLSDPLMIHAAAGATVEVRNIHAHDCATAGARHEHVIYCENQANTQVRIIGNTFTNCGNALVTSPHGQVVIAQNVIDGFPDVPYDAKDPRLVKAPAFILYGKKTVCVQNIFKGQTDKPAYWLTEEADYAIHQNDYTKLEFDPSRFFSVTNVGTYNLAEWQTRGHDLRSTFGETP